MNPQDRRRGRFVVIVGPDGVGKTTLAAELLRAWPGERAYFHFRPPVRGPLQPQAPEAGGFVAAKPDSDNRSRFLGWVRILRSLALFGAGHLFSIRPALRRGALVVGDRWAYPYLAAPAQVHYYGPEWLARSVVSALPQPDLVVCLTAPPDIVVARKAELTLEQVAAQNRTWQSVPTRRKIALLALDPPELLAARVLEQL